jgi:hypothetical protein
MNTELIDRQYEDELTEVEGELVETGDVEELTEIRSRPAGIVRHNIPATVGANRQALTYILLPFIFLTVTLLGGMRLAFNTNAFVFLKPPLVCLIFAAILVVILFRTNLITLNGWFSEEFPALKNAANFTVLLTLFSAAVQIFNSLLPERGLPFWVVAFCFFWTLWTNLFAEFRVKKLLQSLGSLFGLAFVVKYIFLLNLAAADETWTQRLLEYVVKEASLGLLDLPKFSAGTGYIQFFAVVLFLAGLFLLPSRIEDKAR